MDAREDSACCSLCAPGLFPGSGPSCAIKPYVCAFPGVHVHTHGCVPLTRSLSEVSFLFVLLPKPTKSLDSRRRVLHCKGLRWVKVCEGTSLGTHKELIGEGKASLVRHWKGAQRSGGRPWGWSCAMGRGVRATERWESREEEANPARVRGGCRQGLGISWLRRVHGELQAGLSLSDYRSWEGGSALRLVWQEEGYRS